MQVGNSTYFDYDPLNNRICYVNSFNFLNIVPALHRNTYSLMGLKSSYNILATKQIGNYFVALVNNDKHGSRRKSYIYQWNILQAKNPLRSEIPNSPYLGYHIFENYK